MSEAHILTRRMKVQIILALLSDCGCEMTLSGLRLDARRHGLTGAEIEAALAGRSFDACTGAAVALSCALRAGEADALDSARQKARAFGLRADEIAEVEHFAQELLHDLVSRGRC